MIDFLVTNFDEAVWPVILCGLAVLGFWLGGKLPKI